MNTIQNKLDLSEDRKLSFIKNSGLIKKIDSIPKQDGNIVKKKKLITSIIFPSPEIFIKFEIVVSKLFQFGRV